MPTLQSAYCRHHSTETALIRVISDLLAAADIQEVSLIGLLDLSAAFVCVDHDILLVRLEKTFGRDKLPLAWIRGFLTAGTQQVWYYGIQSFISCLTCGVPQGSILGPLLFLLYKAELLNMIAGDGLNAHWYADDTQIYISTKADDAKSAIQRFTNCVQRVATGMTCHRLKLNADKKHVMWTGTRQQLAKIDIAELTLQSSPIPSSKTVNNLGVKIDCQYYGR